MSRTTLTISIFVVLTLFLMPGCGGREATLAPSPTHTEPVEASNPSPRPSSSPTLANTPTSDAKTPTSATAAPPTIEAGESSIPPADLEPLPRIGHPAPDFTLSSLDGEQVTLSDLKGQVVVLNFWATWCVPCRVEMPEFEVVYKQWRDRGVVILGIDVFEDPSRVSAMVDELGITFPILLDREGQVAQSYEVLGYPTTFLVDRDGIVQGMQIGQMHGAVLEAGIKEFL